MKKEFVIILILLLSITVVAKRPEKPPQPSQPRELTTFVFTDSDEGGEDDIEIHPLDNPGCDALVLEGSDKGWKTKGSWIIWIPDDMVSQEAQITINTETETGIITFEGDGRIWMVQKYKCGGDVCGWRVVFEIPDADDTTTLFSVDQSKKWGATWNYDRDNDEYTVCFDDAILRDYSSWIALGTVDFVFKIKRIV
jgi:hypothetical protein